MEYRKLFTSEFYEYFDDYKDTTMVSCINSLNETDKERLYKYWSINSVVSTPKNPIKIIEKLRKILKKYYTKKNLFERFKNYDKALIKEVFNKLDEQERSLVLKLYTMSEIPEEIDTVSEIELHQITEIIYSMNNKLRHKATYVNRDINYQEFFSLFNAPKNTVLEVIDTLPNSDKLEIYAKYGRDLTNTIKRKDFSLKENNSFQQRVIKKIKKRLKALNEGAKIIRIEDLFKGYTKEEEIIKSAASLNNLELVRYFGEKYDLPYFSRQGSIILNEKTKTEMNYKLRGIKDNLIKVTMMKPLIESFIYYKFPNETYEEFASRLKGIIETKLYPEERELVYKKYGKELINAIYYGQYENNKENRRIYQLAYVRILSALANDKRKNETPKRTYKSLLSRFEEGTTIEDILEAFGRDKEGLKLLRAQFGDDYQTPSLMGTISIKDNRRLEQKLLRAKSLIRQKRILNTVKLFKTSDEFKYLKSHFGKENALGVMMMVYISDITPGEIIKISGANIKNVEEIYGLYDYMSSNRLWRRMNFK